MINLLVKIVFISISVSGLLISCSNDVPVKYDLIIRGGTVYDGSGNPGYQGDLAIRGDKIVKVGQLGMATADTEIDANGLAVTPGFINVFSWASMTLPEDGRAMSDIKQGVTLEIFGEGHSNGPLSEMSRALYGKVDVPWTTLGEYMQWLQEKGISPNIAAFVGAATIRIHQLGVENINPDDKQLKRMQELVAEAMEEGALGVSSSLIYTPDAFAQTEELIALAKIAGEYGGIYTSHMRNESDGLLESIDELISIAREANIPAEIYHFKLASKAMQSRFDEVINKIKRAQDEGLKITADIYPYIAAATGIEALMPPWATEGGFKEAVSKMKEPAFRKRVKEAMLTPSTKWQNLYAALGPENVVFTTFTKEKMSRYIGRSLADIAAERGSHPADTAMDLIVEDEGRPMALFYAQTEQMVEKSIVLPWVSFCSDAPTPTITGDEKSANIHPRAYGSFARVLANYVREKKILTFEEAIHRLTLHPAETYNIKNRGQLKAGNFADIAIFDPEKIQDHATYKNPHQYATGMNHVFVNGVQVLNSGEHTGAKPGVFVRGPGWKSNQ